VKREASEQAVAAVVVAWLEALGADVYQEVECAGGVADIVATIRREVWVIEVKTSCSLALLLQAMERRREATRVFVAAPYSKGMRLAGDLFRELGVGVLEIRIGYEVYPGSFEDPCVTERVPSRRWNRDARRLASRLEPQHKPHAKAGAVGGGGRWTPFRSTCEQLAREVRARPGIDLKLAIDSIKHHYRSNAGARSSLAKWITTGKVPGVAKRGSQLYPAESSS
jgi:hypothetical protein